MNAAYDIGPELALWAIVVAAPLAAVAWVMFELDRRELEKFQRRVNDSLHEMRCPNCLGRFESWQERLVPLQIIDGQRQVVGRRLQVQCRDCHGRFQAIERDGAVSLPL